jgi:hypothetical protein
VSTHGARDRPLQDGPRLPIAGALGQSTLPLRTSMHVRCRPYVDHDRLSRFLCNTPAKSVAAWAAPLIYILHLAAAPAPRCPRGGGDGASGLPVAVVTQHGGKMPFEIPILPPVMAYLPWPGSRSWSRARWARTAWRVRTSPACLASNWACMSQSMASRCRPNWEALRPARR